MSMPEEGAPEQLLADLAKAGRVMEETARLEGIDEHSPLGALIKSQRTAMNVFAQIAMASSREMALTREEARKITDLAENERKAVHEDHEKALTKLDGMTSIARQHVEAHKLYRERELQDALERLVGGLSSQLQEKVFAVLREEIPAKERLFYREMTFNAYMRVTCVAMILMILGMVGGYGLTWHSSHVGSACQQSENLDPKTGLLWCILPDQKPTPDAADRQDNETRPQGDQDNSERQN